MKLNMWTSTKAGIVIILVCNSITPFMFSAGFRKQRPKIVINHWVHKVIKIKLWHQPHRRQWVDFPAVQVNLALIWDDYIFRVLCTTKEASINLQKTYKRRWEGCQRELLQSPTKPKRLANRIRSRETRRRQTWKRRFQSLYFVLKT